MYKVSAKFTPSGAQFIELELDGPRHYSIVKRPDQTAIYLAESTHGVPARFELRVFGDEIHAPLLSLFGSAADALAELERLAHEATAGHPKLIAVYSDEHARLKAYVALCTTDLSAPLEVPAIRL